MRRCLLACLSIAFANAAFAHPGHGSRESAGGQSAWHFICEPVHALPLVAVAVLAIVGIKFAGQFFATNLSNKHE